MKIEIKIYDSKEHRYFTDILRTNIANEKAAMCLYKAGLNRHQMYIEHKRIS